MRLGWIAKWALKQTLGQRRGSLAIAALEGPFGALLDMAFMGGRGERELARITEQVDAAVEEIKRAPQ